MPKRGQGGHGGVDVSLEVPRGVELPLVLDAEPP